MKRLILILCTAFLVAACGTVPTPVYEAPATLEAEEGEAVAVVASSTPVPATSTALPPTEAPTEVPTEVATEEVEEVAAEEAPAQDLGANDPLKFFVDLASASNGETLFNEPFETTAGVWACSQCHAVDVPDVRIGPSLLGIPSQAATRVEGEGPYTYLYNSIAHSQVFIVEGFENMVAMPNYGVESGDPAVLSAAQIYDLVAYLMTLEADA